jgi:hypothetical protein
VNKLSTAQKLAIIVLVGLTILLSRRQGLLPGTEVPIDAPGLKVLVVTDPTAKLPGSQVIQLNTITDFVTEVGGEARVIRAGESSTNYEPYWLAAAARPRTSLPWLIVSNKDAGKGSEQPLPLSYDETKKLIEAAK